MSTNIIPQDCMNCSRYLYKQLECHYSDVIRKAFCRSAKNKFSVRKKRAFRNLQISIDRFGELLIHDNETDTSKVPIFFQIPYPKGFSVLSDPLDQLHHAGTEFALYRDDEPS